MKNTFLILAILGTHLSFAQTTRSIEIKVKDTVELKVTNVDLLLTITQDYMDYYGDSYEDEYDGYYDEYEDSEYDDYYESNYYGHLSGKEKRREKKENKKFEKEMKKMEEEIRRYEESMPPIVEEVTYDSTEIDYAIESYESYYMTYAERKSKWITYLNENNISFDTTVVGTNEYYDLGSFNITMTNISLSQLDLIYQFTDSVTNSYPTISKINYESMDSKMDDVYVDLFKKAQVQANSFSKVLGATPGKVIRVYEPAIDIANIGDAYSELLKELMKKNDYSPEMESKKTIVERIFVFEIK